MAVERIIELVTHPVIYGEIMLQLYFLKGELPEIDECPDSTLSPGHSFGMFDMMEDLRSYLLTGTTKEQFGEVTDRLLAKLGQTERKKMVKSFHKVFQLSLNKLDLHLRNLPAYDYTRLSEYFILDSYLA